MRRGKRDSRPRMRAMCRQACPPLGGAPPQAATNSSMASMAMPRNAKKAGKAVRRVEEVAMPVGAAPQQAPQRTLSGWFGKTLGGVYPAADLSAELFKLRATQLLQLLESSNAESSNATTRLSGSPEECAQLATDLAEMGFTDEGRVQWAIQQSNAVRNASVKLLVYTWLNSGAHT
jgi:hypothetical protein